jgi:hypothetical protein
MTHIFNQKVRIRTHYLIKEKNIIEGISLASGTVMSTKIRKNSNRLRINKVVCKLRKTTLFKFQIFRKTRRSRLLRTKFNFCRSPFKKEKKGKEAI